MRWTCNNYICICIYSRIPADIIATIFSVVLHHRSFMLRSKPRFNHRNPRPICQTIRNFHASRRHVSINAFDDNGGPYPEPKSRVAASKRISAVYFNHVTLIVAILQNELQFALLSSAVVPKCSGSSAGVPGDALFDYDNSTDVNIGRRGFAKSPRSIV